ncbi:c-type cytochrome biogenesis protein CcmI [Fertoebacter nigrum]|uniref:C-type cytochrome biogenesis protein CcmI n=1 Tax=Fertoeibacter niger TaxID=2656921 RepID=A0A8X8GZK0_9RHOB|nr:c-type cytochrome biogenesis protein CcmI [Fertoeibacter niger]NUB43409.1 c-type cytochrome biogenesis protein CcmI [Fertoeibacter niger]
MGVVVFWGVAGAVTLAVALVLLAALRRGGQPDDTAAQDMRVYRDQLAEVDRDLARGIIAADEAGRLRAEVSRRVLEADRAAQRGGPAALGGRGLPLAAGLMLVVLGAAVWGYARLGAPGYPDMPMAARIAQAEVLRTNRPAQAEAEASMPASVSPDADPAFLDLMEKLRGAVASRPGDLQGQELLARNEAQLGRFSEAAAAQAQVIALKAPGDSAADHAALAELLILAAGGYVSPEAESALTEALRRDPQDGLARYYSGLMLAQTGRPDLAFQIWRGLLESSGPDAPWLPALRAQIGDMARRAGVDYALPDTALPGPSAADVEAAADMTDADRQAMIEGMVAQLSDRLATEGGPAADWARLIAAYGVLGQTDRAAAIYAEAQGRFQGRTADLAALQSAAEQAGVTEDAGLAE